VAAAAVFDRFLGCAAFDPHMLFLEPPAPRPDSDTALE